MAGSVSQGHLPPHPGLVASWVSNDDSSSASHASRDLGDLIQRVGLQA